jgi:cytoskeleton protein RodZ
MDEGVGKALREARERRKLGLSEVEEATKIRSRFLRALENEEWQRLPGDAYARSFIRTYADFLGLDGGAMAERQRRLSGALRPSEQVPRPEPARAHPSLRGGGRRVSYGVAGLAAVAVAAAIVLALSSGDGGSSSTNGSAAPPPGGERVDEGAAASPPHRPAGLSLRLTATAEVWVCLLDAKGEALVDGQVLNAGSIEGPFQSDSFTVSLGNGEVDMTVDGQQASIPRTPSPIGFTIGRGGSMRELTEGERPTCT